MDYRTSLNDLYETQVRHCEAMIGYLDKVVHAAASAAVLFAIVSFFLSMSLHHSYSLNHPDFYLFFTAFCIFVASLLFLALALWTRYRLEKSVESRKRILEKDLQAE